MRTFFVLVMALNVLHPLVAGPLETAKDLAANKYAGWTYGSNAANKQIDCVQFVAAVVEKELGRPLTAAERDAVLINPAPADLKSAVENGDKVTRGVQYALLDIAGAGSAVEPANAKVGDFIQYWMKKSDGTWVGHCAIISSYKVVSNVPVVSIYGAHQTLNGIGDQNFGGVGLKLTGRDRKVYIVRKN